MEHNEGTEDRHLIEVQHDSKQVFSGCLLNLFVDTVLLPDGSQATREYVKHPGAVAILAQCEDGRLIFERQYRYPLARVMLEIPAGKIETSEDPLNTAKRELLEETGYVSDDWQCLGCIHNCIAYSTEKILIYLAKKVKKVGSQQLDAGEILDVLYMTLDEANDAVFAGKITDAKTISSLFWFNKIATSA